MRRPRPTREPLPILVRAICAAVVIVGCVAAPSARADPDCAPWAGEFDPLPTVTDPDPLRARWARLRVDQLGQLATRAESRDPAEATRLWQRVLCLEPESAAAITALSRTHTDREAEVAVAEPPAPEPARAVVRQRARPRAQRVVGKPAAPSVAEPLAHAESLIRSARFDDALGELNRVRQDAVRPEERVRLEVLAATAQVAFGDETAARASIERALRADPKLALDQDSTSPKLLRVLDDARAVVAAPPYAPAAADVNPLAEPVEPP